MSAQPSIDAGRIRTSQYKLAMVAGDDRHDRIDQISIRHFEQAATSAGMDRTIVAAILNEFAAAMPAAIDSAKADLPEGSPRRLAEQIANGIRERLRLVGFERR